MNEEAIGLLDTMCSLTAERTMFSSEEILDFCLDMRQAFTRETPVAEIKELVAV